MFQSNVSVVMLIYECLMLMLMLCKSNCARLTPRVLQQLNEMEHVPVRWSTSSKWSMCRGNGAHQPNEACGSLTEQLREMEHVPVKWRTSAKWSMFRGNGAPQGNGACGSLMEQLKEMEHMCRSNGAPQQNGAYGSLMEQLKEMEHVAVK